jgi:Zn-dependent M28 family amino/carboxypeptidase
MRRRHLAALLAVTTTLGVAPASASAAEDINSKAFRNAVTVQGIKEHLEALQNIADLNGGTRASGTPGYTASADYVANKLRGAGLSVTRQTFEFPFFQELAPAEVQRTSPSPRTYTPDTDVVTMDYSGSGDVTAQLQQVNDNLVPPPAEPGSSAGCEDGDFSGFTPGNIVLIQRGTCTFEEKAQNAVEAGASAVVLFNEGQEGRTDAFVGTLGRPFNVPVVMLSFAAGEELVNQLRDGDTVTMRVATFTESETRETENVIADSRKGDAAKTIVVGAHLDSVIEGPGINDNGSGTATILEMAEQLGKGGQPKNRVRFAFWGAEEKGLLGSEHYVNTLPADQLSQIKANLNFDMLGSPNFVRFVYDGDGSNGENEAGPNGSSYIEKIFLDYFKSQKLPVEPTAFDGRSDYEAFILKGIPAGGLFSGAEVVKSEEEEAIYGGTAGLAYDPCYHAECDDIDNVNYTSIDQLGDGAAHATFTLARTKNPILDGSQPKGKPKKAKKAFAGHAKQK